MYGEHCVWECVRAFADCIHYKGYLFNTNRVTHQVYKKGPSPTVMYLNHCVPLCYGVPETDYVLPIPMYVCRVTSTYDAYIR